LPHLVRAKREKASLTGTTVGSSARPTRARKARTLRRRQAVPSAQRRRSGFYRCLFIFRFHFYFYHMFRLPRGDRIPPESPGSATLPYAAHTLIPPHSAGRRPPASRVALCHPADLFRPAFTRFCRSAMRPRRPRSAAGDHAKATRPSTRSPDAGGSRSLWNARGQPASAHPAGLARWIRRALQLMGVSSPTSAPQGVPREHMDGICAQSPCCIAGSPCSLARLAPVDRPMLAGQL